MGCADGRYRLPLWRWLHAPCVLYLPCVLWVLSTSIAGGVVTFRRERRSVHQRHAHVFCDQPSRYLRWWARALSLAWKNLCVRTFAPTWAPTCVLRAHVHARTCLRIRQQMRPRAACAAHGEVRGAMALPLHLRRSRSIHRALHRRHCARATSPLRGRGHAGRWCARAWNLQVVKPYQP